MKRMHPSQKQPRDSSSGRKLFGSELLAEERSPTNKAIPTFCKRLDELIGGGILPGVITELVGEKGVGKTTLCLQLCLNVQIPICFTDGLGSEAIFINTESSLSPTRLMEMSVEFVTRCNDVLSDRGPSPHQLLTVNEVMSRIHIINCYDVEELTRTVMGLERYLNVNSKIKLIVIDSIAFPMYSEEERFYKRSRVLYALAQILFKYSNQFGPAVVLTNNLTTRFGEGGKEFTVPFLGDSWSHVPNQRILFSLTNKVRKAELFHSPFCERGYAYYVIIADGFRDP